MTDIFISYASSDRNRVAQIAGHLERLGLRPWLDQEIQTGSEWAQDVAERLRQARCVIVFWSPSAVQSPWVMWEAAQAQALGKLAPAFIESASVPGPLGFIEGARLDIWNGNGDDPEWARLLTSIGRLIDRGDLVSRERERAKREAFLGGVQKGRYPKRILSLDAGGMRTPVMHGFLAAIQELLRRRFSDPSYVLADYFDLIGGASFGGAVAAGLALGQTVDAAFAPMYEAQGRIFLQSHRPLQGARGGASILRRWIEVFGSGSLAQHKWRSLLAVCVKRADTDAAWMITNNPLSLYWDVGSSRIPLSSLIAASIGRPGKMAPTQIDMTTPSTEQIKDSGYFVDPRYFGFSDPSLQLYSMVVSPQFAVNWESSPGSLLIISVGHGVVRRRNKKSVDAQLEQLAMDSVRHTVRAMQTFGHVRKGWRVNSEVGSMEDKAIGAPRLFTYRRFDVDFQESVLAQLLGGTVGQREFGELLKPSGRDSRTLHRLREIGLRAAEREVEDVDFPTAFDMVSPERMAFLAAEKRPS